VNWAARCEPVIDACEVNRAPGAEGSSGGCQREPGEGRSVFVAIAGGGVDREADGADRTAVAQLTDVVGRRRGRSAR